MAVHKMDAPIDRAFACIFLPKQWYTRHSLYRYSFCTKMATVVVAKPLLCYDIIVQILLWVSPIEFGYARAKRCCNFTAGINLEFSFWEGNWLFLYFLGGGGGGGGGSVLVQT